ncbi:nucleotidyltransferase family protein [Crocosphaera sp.]|uniref:nucleotidyltransferase family protein n=1 Tax=Crocosphaera sp. TaxID=2729996 RepID=UPI003F26047B
MLNIKDNSQLNSDLSLDKLLIYRETAKNNWQKTRQQREHRLKKAWELVDLSKTVLKENFGVTKVMVFGSILNENCFNLASDVDIAAWGISPIDTFKAMGELRELDDEIEVNLVDINACSQQLKEKILQEGRDVY